MFFHRLLGWKVQYKNGHSQVLNYIVKAYPLDTDSTWGTRLGSFNANSVPSAKTENVVKIQVCTNKIPLDGI